MSKQTKYTKSARGKECTIRIPGVCNFNNETTVPCHLNGAGMGIKHSDVHFAYGCSDCHDAVDGRNTPKDEYGCNRYHVEEISHMHLEGVIRTQIIMIKEGVLKL